MATAESKRVQRRRVFYIPGYDPIHPRRYREIYRREGAAQAAISDYEISLTAKKSKGPYGWFVDAKMDGYKTTADFEVLVWSDIVRDSMSNSILATYLQLLRTTWIYISTGTLFRLMKLRKGPVIAALYPVGMLALQLIVALLIGWAIASGLGWFVGAFSGEVSGPLVRTSATLIGLVAVVFILRWFQARDNRLMAYYLMHDYAYSARLRGANPPELDARLREFGGRIADALQQDVDEVLVIGHSSGAHLAVTVLAGLIRAGRVPDDGPALGFLSLGQVVPMVSFLPAADQLRGDLQYLSARDELAWIDVSAPGDGCAFALCDPVAVSGVAPADKKWPLVFSAAFTQTLSPERWKELKRRYFRLHFQYLCAFDRPGDYDYFRITAGSKTLADRYNGRRPSKSRIDKPVSRFTSVTTP
ncbi:MAG: hypothetical protein KUG70_07390 [Rhodobacteraceae bacterium]|nr:hypothetical protein [Paracoccaceae bacterium]